LTHVRAALERGDYGLVLELTNGEADPAAAALRVRATANSRGAPAAESLAASAVELYPLCAELHLLRGLLLAELGRYGDAAAAARKVLYLDRTLAIAHFLLGTALARLGDLDGASRSLRNARDLCQAHREDEPVPLADGQRFGRLAEAASVQLDLAVGSAPP
jgi:chemotaxis protein methyltransferase CheR